MTKIAYDAAYPLPDGVANTEVVLIYTGGDTPHVWTAAEIAEQPEQYRLPVFVRSNPNLNDVTGDVTKFVTWLRSNQVPAGSAVVLDLETAVNVAYVNGFGAGLRNAGYKVLPYGSKSSLFQNPELDGYFVADPGAKGVDENTVATQFAYDGTYDLSYIADSVPLWDAKPPAPIPPAPKPPVPKPPTPTPAPTPPGDDVVLPTLNSTTAPGSLWTKSVQAILAGKFGQKIGIDGNYGVQTIAAVEDVQRFFKITVDGITGPETWAILLGL